MEFEDVDQHKCLMLLGGALLSSNSAIIAGLQAVVAVINNGGQPFAQAGAAHGVSQESSGELAQRSFNLQTFMHMKPHDVKLRKELHDGSKGPWIDL
jgi:hypothetical protein